MPAKNVDNAADYADFCNRWHSVTVDGEGVQYYLRIRSGGNAAGRRVVGRIDLPHNTAIDLRREIDRRRRTAPGEACWIESMLVGGTNPIDVVRLPPVPKDPSEEEDGSGESAPMINARDPWSTIAYLATSVATRDDHAHDRAAARIEHLETLVNELTQRLITTTGEAVGGKVLLEWIEKYGQGSETVKVLHELPLREMVEGFRESMRYRREKGEKRKKDAAPPPADGAAPPPAEDADPTPEEVIDRLLTEIVEVTQRYPEKVWARRQQIGMFVRGLESWAKANKAEGVK
jgi:hypothetical protein